MVKYSFNDGGFFVIEQYDRAKTFSSFLPGLAGLKGIPMWVFYVNRGQAVTSFGVNDKNSPITEFFPANQAYQHVEKLGFRTFVKICTGEENILYEPFSSIQKGNPLRRMYIRENELHIEEINEELGLQIKVKYFTIPYEKFAGLVRQVTFTNISGKPLNIEVIDGLPAILPFGVDNSGYKMIGNTLASWMDVFNLENKIPYYHVRSSTSDTARVEKIVGGHFYLSFLEDGELLQPIVDSKIIFGYNTSLSHPVELKSKTVSDLLNTKQITTNKVPCGFSAFSKLLKSHESCQLNTIVGHTSHIDMINEKAEELAASSYLEKKYQEAISLVNKIVKDVETKTANPLFDAYVRQTYLDNTLRGGYPILLERDGKPFVYYVFSRKHGDLERDYNFFSIAAEYYSQGNGNFRDVNQNRRNNIFFHKEIDDYDIKFFYNLIQLDGYNPLVVKGVSFELKDKTNWDWLKEFLPNEHGFKKVQQILNKTFTPGHLIQTIELQEIDLKVNLSDFLKSVFSRSTQNLEAEFGEGYWIDHWTYNLDLIENYLKIYPERLEQLLFDDHSYRYYDSHVYVKPRKEKYVLVDGKIRQYDALEIGNNTGECWVKDKTGKYFTTNLIGKLVTLAIVKFATIDPYGMGIEMEADKPGWNDALNGLPGLFGSGMAETLELKRLLEFIINTCGGRDRTVDLPVEVARFYQKVNQLLLSYQNGELDDFAYWDAVATAREQYRESIKEGIDGSTLSIKLNELVENFSTYLEKVNKGIEKAVQYGNGLVPTYFYYKVKDYEILKDEKGRALKTANNLQLVKVKSFAVHVLPHFLEGPARLLKTITEKEKAAEIYNRVRSSDIYDAKLKMYKTSSSIETESMEIGRIRAFPAGWLERESVFMHMEFKYLFAVLKSGLYDQFFDDIRTVLPPFMDPAVYGRSPLEHSSFIASSVNADPAVHGQGFVARLSGTTAEFLSMWQMMMAGDELFSYQEDKGLTLCLQPILPDWFFDENGEVSFTFLGNVRVKYINTSCKKTYGEDGARVYKYLLKTDDEQIEVHGERLHEPYARSVREGKVKSITVYLK